MGLTVGLCYTKNNKNAVAALEALAKGIEKCGDKSITIFSLESRQYFDECHVLIQIGEFSKFIHGTDECNNLRLFTKEHCNRTQKNRLIVEPGIFSQTNNRFQDNNIKDRYFQICVNYIKSAGLWNIGCDETRWKNISEKFNILIYPWKWNTSKHITILGQNHRGTSVQDVDILDIHKKIIHKLRNFEKITNEIFYLVHPNQSKLPPNLGDYDIEVRKCDSEKQLQQYLLDSWFTVAHTTNASVDAILCGIPLLRTSPKNITASYGISHLYLQDLFHNYSEKRIQFLWDMAGNQFSLDEMERGIFWEIFKKRFDFLP